MQVKVAIHDHYHRIACGHVGRQISLIQCGAMRRGEDQVRVLRKALNEIIEAARRLKAGRNVDNTYVWRARRT